MRRGIKPLGSITYLRKFIFAGFPAYVRAEAERIGRPELVPQVGRIATLSALAGQCAQAAELGTDEALSLILPKAEEYRDQLAIAGAAAARMVADLHAAATPTVVRGGTGSISSARPKR